MGWVVLGGGWIAVSVAFAFSLGARLPSLRRDVTEGAVGGLVWRVPCTRSGVNPLSPRARFARGERGGA
jgi:hypothetical protein